MRSDGGGDLEASLLTREMGVGAARTGSHSRSTDATRTRVPGAVLSGMAKLRALLAVVGATVVVGCPPPSRTKPPPIVPPDGIVIDCPADSAAGSLQEMADRFAADIDPLMERGAGGCIACHAADSGRLMTMADTPQNSFFRIRANGYFRLVTGMIPERVINESMPQGGPAWSADEKDLLQTFACDLATIDDGGIPPDEEFPPDLLSPYTGPAATDYDNTFITYDQLRGRVIQAFDDDWVRLGVDQFSANISLLGGADFVNTFVPARVSTPEFFVGLDLLAEDVCRRAVDDLTGPFAGLDLDAPIQAEPPSASTLLEAEGSVVTINGLPAGCLPGAGATDVNLCTNASVDASLALPSDGDYVITVRAAPQPNPAGPPNMSVSVDGVEVLNVDVTGAANVFADFTVTTHVTSGGAHQFSVAFTNDSTVGGDRNLRIDKYTVDGPVAGTTSGSPTGPADAKARLATIFERILLRPPVVGGAGDEIDELYATLVSLEQFDGDRRGAFAGACQGLLNHPDFLFTRPPAFDTATGGARERLLLIKTALDLIDRPPSADEFGRFDTGEARDVLVDEWLQSAAFRVAYNNRVRAILEFDGTPDGDEPSRLWTFVMLNDRPLKEILTADYTVDDNLARLDRPAEHGATGLLTMKGYITGKPGLPHYNYAARVFTGFMGVVFNVPQAALDARATATAASTVDPTSICFSCHRLLTPLAYQRQKWADDGTFRTQFDDGRVIDDTDNGLVADYPFKGPGLESFSLVAVRKEGFIRRMANVHFTFAFGRNLRHDTDERDVYLSLWNAANSGNGTFKDVMKTVLFSRSYTDPVGGTP